MSQQRLSAVVVTHNSAAHIGHCLRSLETHGLDLVVVVDNGSSDDTLLLVERVALESPDLILQVVRQENLGFGAGNNAGLARLAPAVEFALLVNPDAWIAPHDLGLLIDHLDVNPQCALVVPRLFRGDTPLTSAGALPTFFTEAQHLLPNALHWLLPVRRLPPNYATTGRVPVGEGAVMLARRNVLASIGDFDPSYFLYFEEMELAQRLAANGFEVHLCAEAWAEHAVGASTRQTSFGARPHLEESRARYLARWLPRWHSWAFRGAAAVNWALRLKLGRLQSGERDALRAAAARGRQDPVGRANATM